MNKSADIFCLVGSGSRAAHLNRSDPDPVQNRPDPLVMFLLGFGDNVFWFARKFVDALSIV